MAMGPILRAAVHLCCVSLARGSASFVPAASAAATAPILRGVAPPSGFPGRASLAPTSLASSANGRLGDRARYARTHSAARIPRHPEEAAGITVGLGLWGDVRRRARRRRRGLVEERWNALRSRRSGRRRERLARRFQKHVLRNPPPPSGVDGGEDLDDSAEEGEEEDEEEDLRLSSLDAMRARAGVIRTRVRLRQESLSNLERLKTDVRLEMKRTDWKNIFNADAGYTNRTVFMYGQSSGKEELDGKDTVAVMNEFELTAINEKWERRIKSEIKVNGHASRGDQENDRDERDHNTDEGEPADLMEELQLDRMERRSVKLRNSILLDRIRLQRLERRILCFESNELGILERAVGSTLDSLNELDPATALRRRTKKFVNTLGESTSVLLRKLQRVRTRSGPSNRGYGSVADFAALEAAAGVRIVGSLLSNPSQLSQLVDPDTPALVPHVPAILARLDRLESHVEPILNRVLNNKRHLRSIEPYLDEVLERFDDIEPHLPWILDHIDTLAPYTGLLLKHIDELLLYAEVDEYEAGDDNYAFAEQLLPYLEVYVSQLDLVGPHLPLLRPHLPLLLKHDRIKILSPHVGKLFAKGYADLSASANMDILLFYFGWALRIPLVPRFFFALAPPSTVSFLANRLPKRLVRGQCCDVTCNADGDYGKGWNELSK